MMPHEKRQQQLERMTPDELIDEYRLVAITPGAYPRIGTFLKQDLIAKILKLEFRDWDPPGKSA